MKHTELPWEYKPSGGNHRNYEIWGKNGETITKMFTWLDSDNYQEQIANAAFIVKAVNNHEKLLGALKDLMESISGGKKECGHDFACVCSWDKAMDAVKQAEAE